MDWMKILLFMFNLELKSIQVSSSEWTSFVCISDNRAGPSNLGNVISQILLCKQITPDFNQEELCSITKDSQEISRILKEMQEYMPQQENNLGTFTKDIFIKYLYIPSSIHPLTQIITHNSNWENENENFQHSRLYQKLKT